MKKIYVVERTITLKVFREFGPKLRTILNRTEYPTWEEAVAQADKELKLLLEKKQASATQRLTPEVRYVVLGGILFDVENLFSAVIEPIQRMDVGTRYLGKVSPLNKTANVAEESTLPATTETTDKIPDAVCVPDNDDDDDATDEEDYADIRAGILELDAVNVQRDYRSLMPDQALGTMKLRSDFVQFSDTYYNHEAPG